VSHRKHEFVEGRKVALYKKLRPEDPTEDTQPFDKQKISELDVELMPISSIEE
jgi:hypothetical protein